MFDVLHQCGALQVLIPEINYVKNKNYIKRSLEYGNKFKYSLDIKAAIFFMHVYASKTNVKDIAKIYTRLSVPNSVRKLTEKLADNMTDLREFKKLKPRQILDLIYKMDLFRNPDVLIDIIKILEAYNEGQAKKYKSVGSTLKALQKYLKHLNKLNLGLISQNKTNPDIKASIYEARLHVLKKFI